MANVIRDPRQHPDAIVADFSKPNPVVNFSKGDIAFVYGSKWKQRYFKKAGDDYFPLGAQWDIAHKKWSAYFVRPGTDWWVSYYPADNMKRPTGPTCDGCHSVNYDVATKQVTEWNVGCEKCHDPGGDHVRQPSPTNIVNPARLDTVDATNTCVQCHSQELPLTPHSPGKAYDWPVGFDMRKHLEDFCNSKSPNSARPPSRTSPTARRTEIVCRGTTWSRALCIAGAWCAVPATTFTERRTTRI